MENISQSVKPSKWKIQFSSFPPFLPSISPIFHVMQDLQLREDSIYFTHSQLVRLVSIKDWQGDILPSRVLVYSWKEKKHFSKEQLLRDSDYQNTDTSDKYRRTEDMIRGEFKGIKSSIFHKLPSRKTLETPCHWVICKWSTVWKSLSLSNTENQTPMQIRIMFIHKVLCYI